MAADLMPADCQLFPHTVDSKLLLSIHQHTNVLRSSLSISSLYFSLDLHLNLPVQSSLFDLPLTNTKIKGTKSTTMSRAYQGTHVSLSAHPIQKRMMFFTEYHFNPRGVRRVIAIFNRTFNADGMVSLLAIHLTLQHLDILQSS